MQRVKLGQRRRVDSLIAEEALLVAKYLREKIPHWTPRIPELLEGFSGEVKVLFFLL